MEGRVGGPWSYARTAGARDTRPMANPSMPLTARLAGGPLDGVSHPVEDAFPEALSLPHPDTGEPLTYAATRCGGVSEGARFWVYAFTG